MEGSGFIDATILPTTGTYTILVDPVSWAIGNLTLALYTVSDYTNSITAGGAPVTVPISTPGQNGLLTFAGTAGQKVSLVGSNGTIAGQILGCDVNVSILNPDNSVLAPATCMEGSGFIDATTLPTTGTYTIRVDPVSFATGNLTLTLYTVADYTNTITQGGAPVTVSISTPGQNGVLTFSGAASERVSLNGTNGTIAGQILGCDVNVSIVRQRDNLVVAAGTCMEVSGFIDVTTLPTTDTYVVLVDPVSTATGNLTLTLYDVPADISETITIGGSQTLTTTTPGQNGTMTFVSGTSGQSVTVHLTNNSMGSVTVTLYDPNGTSMTSTTSSAGAFDLTSQSLTITGTYTIKIDPAGPNVGSISVNITTP
jgi:hypothetical protein